MINGVKRIFVEKKKGFDVEAHSLYSDLKENLGVRGLEAVRIINRYDISGISDKEYEMSRNIIFSEPTVDYVYDETLPTAAGDRLFAMEYLPGQYDQRADSAAQCVQILAQKDRPNIISAKVIVLKGTISDSEFEKIKGYCINPVDSREASLDKPSTLEMKCDVPKDVEVIAGFVTKTPDELQSLMDSMGFAMSIED
ncbi:MAG: phosphoribosylformylglycinamidine synthase, partial [Eubacteriales bacterium]